jgi:hypothetical protein
MMAKGKAKGNLEAMIRGLVSPVCGEIATKPWAERRVFRFRHWRSEPTAYI